MNQIPCPLCGLPLDTVNEPDGNTGQWTTQLTKRAARHVTSRHAAEKKEDDQ